MKEVFVSDIGNCHMVEYTDVKNEIVKINENYNLILKIIKIDTGHIDTPDNTTTFRFKDDEKNIYRFLKILCVADDDDDEMYTILTYKSSY